MDNDLNSTPNV